jgi:hypothetical protein
MEGLRLNFETSHHQFYIADASSPFETGSFNFWTNEAFDAKLAQEVGVLGVGTGCYGNVKVEVFLLEEENKSFDADLPDHIVEAGLEIPSGLIQVSACTDNSILAELKVQPGNYRFRIYSFNLDTIIDEDNGDDFYNIEIWMDELMDRRVIKQYQ